MDGSEKAVVTRSAAEKALLVEQALALIRTEAAAGRRIEIDALPGEGVFINVRSPDGVLLDRIAVQTVDVRFFEVTNAVPCVGSEPRGLKRPREVDASFSLSLQLLENCFKVVMDETSRYKLEDSLGSNSMDSISSPDPKRPKPSCPTATKEISVQTDSSASTDQYVPGGILAVQDVVSIVTCSICVDILHDAVTPSPCTHTFCGGCLSKWIYGSEPPNFKCPECREPMRYVTHDHKSRNLVQALAQVAKKSAEEKKELDGRNKFLERRIHNLIETVPGRRRRQLRPRRRTSTSTHDPTVPSTAEQ